MCQRRIAQWEEHCSGQTAQQPETSPLLHRTFRTNQKENTKSSEFVTIPTDNIGGMGLRGAPLATMELQWEECVDNSSNSKVPLREVMRNEASEETRLSPTSHTEGLRWLSLVSLWTDPYPGPNPFSTNALASGLPTSKAQLKVGPHTQGRKLSRQPPDITRQTWSNALMITPTIKICIISYHIVSGIISDKWFAHCMQEILEDVCTHTHTCKF